MNSISINPPGCRDIQTELASDEAEKVMTGRRATRKRIRRRDGNDTDNKSDESDSDSEELKCK